MLQRKKKVDYKNYKEKNKENVKNTNKSIIAMYIMIVILVGVLLFLHISQTVTITHLSYKTDKLQSELNKIKNENHQLQIKIARKLSLKKIEKIARTKLGMKEPKNTEYIALENLNKNKEKIEKKEEQNMFFALKKLFKKWETVRASSPE